MDSPKIVDSVDVSDVCREIDQVTLYRDGVSHQAAPFVEDDHGLREVDIDLTDYPAVVAIAKRAFDTDRPVTFAPPPTIADRFGGDG